MTTMRNKTLRPAPGGADVGDSRLDSGVAELGRQAALSV